MAPASLLSILTTGGYGIRLEGERLIVHPADALTDPLRNLIRANKPGLVRYLRQMQAPADDPAPAVQVLPVPASHAVEIVMASSPEVDVPRHCWWVHDERGTFSIDFGPRVTLTQVRELYPNAEILEDEVD